VISVFDQKGGKVMGINSHQGMKLRGKEKKHEGGSNHEDGLRERVGKKASEKKMST